MKQKRYWLRGLMTGAIVGAILYGMEFFPYLACTMSLTKDSGMFPCGLGIFAESAWLPVYRFFQYMGVLVPIDNALFNPIVYLVSLAEFVILFSIIGLSIGWLYGKIKNRNQVL